MTVATPLLTKKLWWFVLVWLWHKHLSLLYWSIFPQYEDRSHPVAADAIKDNYYQHLQLPSRDKYPCHAKQWPTPTSIGKLLFWRDVS